MDERPGQAVSREEVNLWVEPDGTSVGFSLEFHHGLAWLTSQKVRLPQGLTIERLTLEVPSFPIPLDTSAEIARFKHQRCKLHTLEVSVSQETLLAEWLARVDARKLGLDGLRLRFGKDAAVLQGTWSAWQQQAPFSVRWIFDPQPDGELILWIAEVRVFGWMPLPDSALISQLSLLLSPFRVASSGRGCFSFHPARELLRWLLPSQGWKMPDLRQVCCHQVRLEAGEFRWVLTRDPSLGYADIGGIGHPLILQIERDLALLRDGTSDCEVADRLLLDGDLEQARGLYLGALERDPSHPYATLRLLEIDRINPARFRELKGRIAELLRGAPDCLPAWICRASLEEQLKRSTAGSSWERVAEICLKREEKDDAVLAFNKAAELFRRAGSAHAVRLYERAITVHPDCLEAACALADFYESSRQWYRAIRMNQKRLASAREPTQLAEAHYRIGRIHWQGLKNIDKGIVHLENALAFHAEHCGALTLLASLLLERGEGVRAADLLLHLATVQEADGATTQAIETRLRLAELWERDPASHALALGQYGQIEKIHPDHPRALFGLGRMAAALGQVETAEAALTRLLELHTAGSVIPAAWIREAALALGRIFAGRAHGEAEAIACYRRALAADEGDLETWCVLGQMVERHGPPQEREPILDRIASLASERLDWNLAEQALRERLALLTGGDFYADRLGDCLFKLADVLQRQGRSEEARALYLELLELPLPDDLASQTSFRVGRILQTRLRDWELAVRAFEQAVALNPRWLTAWSSLADVLEKTGRWERLIQVKVKLSEFIEGPDGGMCFHEAARIAFEKIADRGHGIELLIQATARSRVSPLWVRPLAEALEKEGEHGRAADLWERLLRAEPTLADLVDTPAALWKRVAGLRMGADQLPQAVESYLQAVQLDPGDEGLFSALMSLLASQNRHEEMACMLQAHAERKSGAEAAEAWKSAAFHWQEVSEGIMAQTALHKALLAKPGDEEIELLLVRALHADESWEELESSLQALPGETLRRTEFAEMVRRWFARIGSRLGEGPRLVSALRLMWRVEPNDSIVGLRLAGLLCQEGEEEEAETVYRTLDARADLLDARQRFHLDLSLSIMDFARGRTGEAEVRLKRCAEFDPQDPLPREWLHRLYSGAQRFGDQVALLLVEAERTPDKGARFEKIFRAAEIMERELANPRGAAELYERAAAEGPDQIRVWQKLINVYRWLDRPEKQREAFERLSERGNAEECLSALRKAGRLAQDVLKDGAAARIHWSRVLAMVPSDLEALDRLLSLDRAERTFGPLAEHLGQRALLTCDPVLRVALWREQADLLEDPLHQPERAIEVWLTIRERTPEDRSILQRLAPLYEATNNPEALCQTLLALIERTPSERDRIALWRRVARLCEERLGDLGEAIRALREAAALDCKDVSCLMRLRALTEQVSDERLLAETFEALADRTAEAGEVHGYLRSAGLLRWKVGQPEEARRSFHRACSLQPEDVISRRFLAEIGFAGNPAACLPHLQWMLAHPEWLLPADAKRLRGRWEQASLLGSPTGEDLAAAPPLPRSEPGELPEARESLCAWHARLEELLTLEEWDSFLQEAQRLDGSGLLTGRSGETTGLWRLLARGHRGLLAWDDAARCWEEVLRREPADPAAGEALIAHAANRLDFPRVVELVRGWLAQAAGTGTGAERCAARWTWLADVLASGLGDLESALDALHNASRLTPEEPRAAFRHFERLLSWGPAFVEQLEEAIRVATLCGEWAQVASWSGQALEARLQAGLAAEEGVVSYLALSVLYEKKLADIARATLCVSRALELKPQDPALLLRLGRLYACDWSRATQAVAVFRQLLGLEPEQPEWLAMLGRLEDVLGRRERSAWYYQGLSFLDPDASIPAKFAPPNRRAKTLTRPLLPQEWSEVILHPDADCLLQRILAASADFLEPQFSEFETDRQNATLVQEGQGNFEFLWNTAQTVRWLVSGRAFALWVSPQLQGGVRIEPGKRPSILVAQALVERGRPSELFFQLARAVTLVAMGHVLPRHLGRESLFEVFCRVALAVCPDRKGDLPITTSLSDKQSSLAHALSRTVRDSLRPLVERFLLAPRNYDLDAWCEGVDCTAQRLALLVSRDLGAALSILGLESPTSGQKGIHRGARPGEWLRADARMMSLFRYGFTERFVALLEELSLSLSRTGRVRRRGGP